MSADTRPTARIFTLLLGLAVPATAVSYSLTGTTWQWQDHAFEDPVRLDTGEWPADAGTHAEIEDNIVDAMDEWNSIGIDLQYTYGGRISNGQVQFDGWWDIQHDPTDGSAFGSALAYAGTWYWSDQTGNDCDIVFLSSNAFGDVNWASSADDAGRGRYHIQPVALHELGHCIGLDHASSTSAVMYAHYTGLDTLASDDINGAIAVHGATPCVDGDGDGFSDCDLDCDDSSAAVNPGASETCNGLDDNCDGVVDLDQTLDVSFNTGSRTTLLDDWYAFGNAFTVDQPTMLVRVEQSAWMDPGIRLVWSVYSSTDGGTTWDLVRSERGVSTSATTQVSPDLHLPLTAGLTYTVNLGAIGEDIEMEYSVSGSLASVGPLTPLGLTSGRALGDGQAIDNRYLTEQTLVVIDEEDPDGDGETAQCGDCAPDDGARHSGATEVCNGLDDNCDGDVDEGFQVDADSDGVIDCLDPCPADADDDSDGDGSCDSDDPCPDDPANDSDGDGACDSDDPCPDDPNDDSDGDGVCDSDDPCPDDPDDDCGGDDGGDEGGDDGSSGDTDDPDDESSGGGSIYVPEAKTEAICGVAAPAASVWLLLGILPALARRRR